MGWLSGQACLLCKQEDLHLNPLHTEKGGMAMHACSPSIGREGVEPGTCWELTEQSA